MADVELVVKVLVKEFRDAPHPLVVIVGLLVDSRRDETTREGTYGLLPVVLGLYGRPLMI